MFNFADFSVKKVFSIFLILALFFTVSCVCASDVDEGVLVIGGTLLVGTPVGWSLLIGGALIVGGSALIAYSDGLFDHPTSLNSWIFVAGDIVISAAGGAYAHTVLKVGVDTGDLVLDLIYGTLEISLSESFKYIISNFYNV